MAIQILLRITATLLLLGHAWVCWNGDMPLRALLWDEGLVKGAVKGLTGLEWGEWVGTVAIDERISEAIKLQAGLFAALALVCLLPTKGRLLAAACLIATLNLTFLAWLKYHDASHGLGQFFEHFGQVLTPLVLLCWVRDRRRAAYWIAVFGVTCTFVGHGLFALDVESESIWLNHPRPGHFTEMTMLCLGLETEAAANRLLLIAGVLDLIVAVLIFTAGWPRVIALWWMVIWGFATALARPWAYYEPTMAAESLERWIPEALYRTPHFALPLFLLLALRARGADVSRPSP